LRVKRIISLHLPHVVPLKGEKISRKSLKVFIM